MPQRVDANQAEIAAVLREVGASVHDLHAVGQNLPDLLAGFRGVNYLLEVKSARGQLSPGQARWHDDWRGQVAVVRTPWQALVAIGAVEDVSPSREPIRQEVGRGLA